MYDIETIKYKFKEYSQNISLVIILKDRVDQAKMPAQVVFWKFITEFLSPALIFISSEYMFI